MLVEQPSLAYVTLSETKGLPNSGYEDPSPLRLAQNDNPEAWHSQVKHPSSRRLDTYLKAEQARLQRDADNHHKKIPALCRPPICDGFYCLRGHTLVCRRISASPDRRDSNRRGWATLHPAQWDRERSVSGLICRGAKRGVGFLPRALVNPLLGATR